MTTLNFFCFYLQNRLIQTSQIGGQRYSDTSPFSIPWSSSFCFAVSGEEKAMTSTSGLAQGVRCRVERVQAAEEKERPERAETASLGILPFLTGNTNLTSRHLVENHLVDRHL
jgi:hypothetical protein